MIKDKTKVREKDLTTLEYDKFLKKLSEFTPNEKTKEKIISLKPITDKSYLVKRIKKTEQFIKMTNELGYLPLTEYPDIQEGVNLLNIEESILSPEEILKIKSILTISREIKKTLSPYIKELDEIQGIYKELYSSREIENIINESLDKSGMVKDSASRDLLIIRKNLREVEKKIQNILENILNNPKYSDIIQDRIITIRKDRYVIPVKPTFSGKIRGIIHDRSSTGFTIYLEPETVVDLNNKLSDLKIREHIEIRKILKFLTDILRKKRFYIKRTFETVIEIDFLYTIWKYSSEFNCIFPELSDHLNLINAKHPLFLMNGKSFKPLNIILENKDRGLVITGPNTGGKTVALKTAGLLSFIYLSGIPISVSEESKIPFFDWIYTDIGDMQSIEQNLSTYSAHIKNINEILTNSSENSLILLDELIPGTDPDEGSAIGIGILEKIKERNSFCIVTTHFKQIKMYALSNQYYKTASVGFDMERLSPTYSLHYNSVGQSMAFYIAEKLGFDNEILETAKKYLSESSLKLNEAISRLELYKKSYEEQKLKLEEMEKKLKRDIEKYEKLIKEYEEEKKKKWESITEEAREYIENLRKEGYRIIEDIKKNPSGKELEKFIITRKKEFSNNENKVSRIQDKIEIGDIVKIKGKRSEGTVLALKDKKVNVDFNGIKIWVSISELEKVSKKSENKKSIRVNRSSDKTSKYELKIIGKKREEAIKELSEFIDRAVLDGLSSVRIIHGYGSGILRKTVREYLDRLPYNIKYEDAPYNEGGMGVTIVHIK
ncbi:endonuclease MutS2 [Persephonella sp.]